MAGASFTAAATMLHNTTLFVDPMEARRQVTTTAHDVLPTWSASAGLLQAETGQGSNTVRPRRTAGHRNL
jgi:hypothetical protein